MRAFIASRDENRIREIEAACAGSFEDSVHLLAFDLTRGPESVVTVTEAIDESEFYVADWCGGLDTWDSFLFGVARSVGVPIVGLVGPGEHPEREFAPLRDVVTALDSLGELRLALQRLTAGLEGGIETYAEAAGELHAEYRERVR